ncbi:MAG: hypothetical protein ACLPN5_01460 [Roseiarcus sp.]
MRDAPALSARALDGALEKVALAPRFIATGARTSKREIAGGDLGADPSDFVTKMV